MNRVYESLNEKGIFIFDCKPTNSFKNKERYLEEKDFTFEWVCNTKNAPFVIIDINTTFKDGTKFNERHIERGYSVDELKQIIQSTKFELLEIYDTCELKEPNNESDLIQFVLKK